MRNLNEKDVYLLYTNDYLQLPVCVTDTLEEMSKLVHYPFFTLYKALKRNSVIGGVYRIEKVDIFEKEDMFNFKDYLKYCLEKDIKPSNFVSLDEFRRFCYG